MRTIIIFVLAVLAVGTVSAEPRPGFVGDLVGGIADTVNTVVGIIIDQAIKLLDSLTEDDSKTADIYIGAINSAIKGIITLIRSIAALSNEERNDLVAIVNQFRAGAIALASAESRDDVDTIINDLLCTARYFLRKLNAYLSDDQLGELTEATLAVIDQQLARVLVLTKNTFKLYVGVLDVKYNRTKDNAVQDAILDDIKLIDEILQDIDKAFNGALRDVRAVRNVIFQADKKITNFLERNGRTCD